MIMSLALVVGFIFAAAWVVRRMPFGLGARGNGPLKVLAALPLGPQERLVLVEARGEELLIAVSPAGVFNVGAAARAGARPRAAAPSPRSCCRTAMIASHLCVAALRCCSLLPHARVSRNRCRPSRSTSSPTASRPIR